MSILIKGMEMPKNCEDCPLNGFIRCNLTNTKFELGKIKNDDCPLVSIPPHGRLIDADALKVDDGWLVATREQFNHIQFVYANAIVYAPTIIEAEGEP